MAETITELIYMMGLVMLLSCFLIKQYPKNYWLQAMMLLLGSWFYGVCISLFETNGCSIVFPVIGLVMNLMLTLFMLSDNFRVDRK